MRLSQFKSALERKDKIRFRLPDGSFVPGHFHVTEVGQIDKRFIDCGGTLRDEKVISFQLWEANDYDHRLHPDKLVDIISLSEKALSLGDFEIEVEYQGDTIGKYGLDVDGEDFILTAMKTDCLAKDNCGVPQEKPRVKLKDLAAANEGCCTPGSGCC